MLHCAAWGWSHGYMRAACATDLSAESASAAAVLKTHGNWVGHVGMVRCGHDP
eukprot:m.38297 g.38297  ORF g.38297 m.38297 type:complete len:53 (+) comp13369_c0_seq1:609-767(+)